MPLAFVVQLADGGLADRSLGCATLPGLSARGGA
jgi:hypothetical protein